MSEYPAVFGIDSHARTTTVCAIVVETGETATRTFPGVSPYAEVASWMSSFPGPRMGWYEAGCTGFAPALQALRRRHARGADSHPLHAHKPRGQGEEDRPDGRRQARQGGACRPALRGLHLTLLEDRPQVVGKVGLGAPGGRTLAGHEA